MYTILGFGLQGKAIVHYLLNNTDEQIESYDLNPIDSSDLRWTTYCWDILKEGIPVIQSDKKRTVISCLPTQFNLNIVKQCVKNGWNYIDLGGSLKHSEEIEKYLKSKKGITSTFVLDCGVAPGLVSTIAGHLEQAGCKSVNLYCGGLPENKDTNYQNYALVFNAEGLYKEYTGIVEYRKDNKICYLPSLSDLEYVPINLFGTDTLLEAASTSSSLSFSPRLSKLENLSYKTLRYYGHYDFLKEHIFWQPNPIEILSKIFQKIDNNNPDILILMYKTDQHPYPITYIWKYDLENNISAMAQSTGYTVAAVAHMMHDENLNKGLVYMDNIDFNNLWNKVKLISKSNLLIQE